MNISLLCAGVVALTVSTAAFVPARDEVRNILRWNLAPPFLTDANVVNPETGAIRLFLGAEAYSEANREAELNAIRAAFAQWQAVPHTLLRFEEAGLVAGPVDVDTGDNRNVVFWVKGTTFVNGGLDNIFGTTAATFSEYFLADAASNRTFAEADIVFNGAQFSWFTDYEDSASAAQFVEGTALHEIGHLIGLDHSPAGAATMFFRSAPGINNPQIGLSPDEIAAAQTLYPAAVAPLERSGITGRITMNNGPVFGAAVIVESVEGNLLSATVSTQDGSYTLPALPVGPASIRVCPLDPAGSGFTLVRGLDIAPDYAGAVTGFLPSQPIPIDLPAGQTVVRDFAVVPGTAPLRIARIRPAASTPENRSLVNTAAVLKPGQSNLFVGVYTPTPLSSNAILKVTGGGLTLGTPLVEGAVFGDLNLISVPVSVAPTAIPGLRSFVLEQGNDRNYANGFLEILPSDPDYNFDRLDDRFQRRHFPLFTAPEAAPSADPDRDGHSNAAEYLSASNPVDAGSVLRIESVRLDATGSTVTWRSVPGHRYQVYSRPEVGPGIWTPTGGPVAATGERTELLDASATQSMLFYRVEVLP